MSYSEDEQEGGADAAQTFEEMVEFAEASYLRAVSESLRLTGDPSVSSRDAKAARTRAEELRQVWVQTREALRLKNGDAKGLEVKRPAVGREERRIPSDLVKYNGDGDVLKFISEFEAKLFSVEIPEDRWPRLLVGQLEHPLNEWLIRHLRKNPAIDWHNLKDQWLAHMGLHDRLREYRQRFLACKQGKRSVRAYRDEFVTLATAAAVGLDQPTIMVQFQNGLSQAVQDQLSVATAADPPRSFEALSAIACRLSPLKPRTGRGESEISDKKASSRRSKCAKCRRWHTVGAPCKTKKEASKAPVKVEAKKNRSGEDSAKVTCFKCHKRGHYANACPNPPSQLTAAVLAAHAKEVDTSGDVVTASMMTSFLDQLEEEETKGSGLVAMLSVTDSEQENATSSSPSPSSVSFSQGMMRLKGLPITLAPVLAGEHSSVGDPESRGVLSVPCKVNGERVWALPDTGAEISVLDADWAKRQGLDVKPAPSSFVMADGKRVPSGGRTRVQLEWGNRSVSVLVDLLPLPRGYVLLIGQDLLPSLGARLVGLPTQWPDVKKEPDITTTDPSGNGFDMEQGATAYTDSARRRTRQQIPAEDHAVLMDAIKEELEANAAIPDDSFCPHPDAMVALPVSKEVPYRPQYKLASTLVPVVTKQVDEWHAKGWTKDVSPATRFNNPLLCVPKKDAQGRWLAHRVCLDTRALNAALPPRQTILPTVDQIYDRVQGFAVASTLDLSSAFMQLRVLPEHQHLLTFRWLSVTRCFTRGIFGVMSMPDHMQRVLTIILAPHAAYCAIYIDDLVIWSNSLEDHISQVKAVLATLNANRVRLSREKCHFGLVAIDLLGQVLTGLTRAAHPDKTSMLANWPKPESVKQLRAFLGFVNYLREFIPNYAHVAAPLEAVRNVKSKKLFKKAWSPACSASFEAFKSILASSPVIESFNPEFPFIVGTDASQFGIGCVLLQEYEGRAHYIAFAARSLTAGQRNYSATRRELLAIVFALQRWRHYLLGRHFELRTDHKALTYLFSQRQLNYMLLKWYEVLMEYSFDVVHCPGILHVLPDAISRAFLTLDGERSVGEVPLLPPSIKKLIALALDPSVKYPLNLVRETIKDRLSKVCPPVGDRKAILLQQHEGGHFSAEALFRRVWHAGFFWPSLRQDCIKLIAKCEQCTRHAIRSAGGFAPLRPITASLVPMDHVAFDLAGPFETTPRGDNHVLDLVDGKALESARRTDRKRKRHKPIAVGSVVMIIDPIREDKMAPIWIGPYKVLRRGRGGAYSLLDDQGALLTRKVPPEHIRVITTPDAPDQELEPAYQVDEVLDHRGNPPFEYLVKWTGYDASHNSWEPFANFNDTSTIRAYWNAKADQ
jgi:hypothetical protein